MNKLTILEIYYAIKRDPTTNFPTINGKPMKFESHFPNVADPEFVTLNCAICFKYDLHFHGPDMHFKDLLIAKRAAQSQGKIIFKSTVTINVINH